MTTPCLFEQKTKKNQEAWKLPETKIAARPTWRNGASKERLATKHKTGWLLDQSEVPETSRGCNNESNRDYEKLHEHIAKTCGKVKIWLGNANMHCPHCTKHDDKLEKQTDACVEIAKSHAALIKSTTWPRHDVLGESSVCKKYIWEIMVTHNLRSNYMTGHPMKNGKILCNAFRWAL